MRGEDIRQVRWSNSPADSPPRTRGRRARSVSGRGGRRLTPAYAGKTIPPLAELPVNMTHPRVCGKDQNQHVTDSPVTDSPPRARGDDTSRARTRESVDHPGVCGGRPGPERVSDGRNGLTPACAGKTLRDLG
nr:hypothetical protein GCM10020241_51200 [Streptoalloteichus tenebrarius]